MRAAVSCFLSLEVHLQVVFFQRCQAITHKTRKLGWLLEAIDSKSGTWDMLTRICGMFVHFCDKYSEGLTVAECSAWDSMGNQGFTGPTEAIFKNGEMCSALMFRPIRNDGMKLGSFVVDFLQFYLFSFFLWDLLRVLRSFCIPSVWKIWTIWNMINMNTWIMKHCVLQALAGLQEVWKCLLNVVLQRRWMMSYDVIWCLYLGVFDCISVDSYDDP